MKILVVTHYYPAHIGGIEMVSERLCKELALRGAQITWVASDTHLPNPQSPSEPHIKYVSMCSWNGIERNFQLPYPLWGLRSCRKLWREVKKCDVVHLHEYIYHGCITAYFAARILKKPIIITQYAGVIPYPNPLKTSILKLIHRTLGRKILNGARRVIFVSDVVKGYFESMRGFRKDSEVYINGVDTEKFQPLPREARNALRKTYRVEEGSQVILFVGRFVERKGLPVIRELAQRLPQVQFLMAGRGEVNPEDWKLPNLKIFRDAPTQVVSELYQVADLFVLPSYGEGFPLVVQEAMACGTPALVGTESAEACPEARPLIWSLQVGGPETSDRWEKRIREILSDKRHLEKTRDEQSHFVQLNWSWGATADRYWKIFQSL